MANKTLFLAGILSFLLMLLHVFGGGAEVQGPILASSLDNVLKGFSSVVWHGVTANLFICSCLLIYAALKPDVAKLIGFIVIAHYLAYAGLFIFYGAIRFGSLFVMVPWIGFLIITAVIFLGLFRKPKNI